MPHCRPGILGIFQQTIEMALVLEALGIRQNARHHTAYRIGHRHGSDLATGQHEVTQRDLLVHTFIDESLVDALIMAADDDDIVHLAEANGIRLLEGMTAGRHINGMHRAAGFLADRFPAAIQGVCGHHSATAAAIRIIIYLILLICGVVPDLMGLDADEAPLLGPAEDALAQNIAKRVGKQGHDINSHRCASLR